MSNDVFRKFEDFLIARGSAEDREKLTQWGGQMGAKGTSTRSKQECDGSAAGRALAPTGPQGGLARSTVR